MTIKRDKKQFAATTAVARLIRKPVNSQPTDGFLHWHNIITAYEPIDSDTMLNVVLPAIRREFE